MGKSKYLVIVESPAKARTISKFLGREYIVKASFGHVMDLPKSKLGFDPNNNYKPEYVITRDKHKVVRELKSYIDRNTIIYLASDDDREGEKISETLLTALKIPEDRTRRIVFHSITKEAITNAMENPRRINHSLSDAAKLRRIIDRAVGYKLSPLLWQKIMYGLSAGRVQSVAVRIIVDREKQIQEFIPEEYWKLKLDILSNPTFKAELAKKDNKNIKVKSEGEAYSIKKECDSSNYILDNIVEKESTRNPAPPFTTSTLQQEASRKLGFSVKQTMNIAQKLYEGSISIPGHEGGLITYMRTDSMHLSNNALKQLRDTIMNVYGNEYTIPNPRRYSKSKQAVESQEAHESIRPTKLYLKPSDIERYLDKQEFKLYSLIWKRTMATQMAQARVANTTYNILGGKDKNYTYIAKGTKILFPGFMKVYTESKDEQEDDNIEKFLPNIPEGTVFEYTKLTPEQFFTKPPARYTEASLVKKMEAEGIGRPSTYASTINTIITREYVIRNKEKRLEPTKIGIVVNDYLVVNFPDIVDLHFTAKLEEEFDKVAKGELKWFTVMDKFYKKFIEGVKKLEGTNRIQYSDARVIGKDEKTGEDITVRTGRYGSYLQIGESDKENGIKPTQVSTLPKDIKVEDITMEQALHYLKVPRVLGNKEDMPISVGIGRFGPFVKYRNIYYSLKVDDPYEITLDRALEIIKEQDEIKAKELILDINDKQRGRIQVLNGRYNPYIKAFGKGKTQPKGNFKLPKGMSEEEVRKLTQEDVFDILDKSRPKKPYKKKRR